MILLLLSWFFLLSVSMRISIWLGIRDWGLGIGVFGRIVPGLAVLLLVLQVWGFVLPLKYAGIGIGLVGIWALRHGVGRVLNSNGRLPAQGDRHGAWKYWAVLLVCLMPAVLPAWINDDFAYYLPGIKWFAGEGWVPGLANLNVRFGLSSSWHALSAAFYWEGVSPDRIWNFNGLLLFLFCKELLDRFPDRPFAVWGALLFGVPFCNAPSPDLPVALLGAYALINLRTFSFKEWIWWAVLLIGLKATAISVLILFPLAFTSITKKNWPWLVLPLMAGLIWIGKNLVLSGHPFFPYALFEQANAYPTALLTAFREGVLAEIYGVGFSMEAWKNTDLNGMERLVQLTRIPAYKIAMNLLVLLSSTWIIFHFIRKGNRSFAAAALVVLGMFMWLFFTPNYRFFLAPVLACGVYLDWPRIAGWRHSSLLFLLPLIGAIWLNRGTPETLRIISCGPTPPLSFEQFIVPNPYPVPESERIHINTRLEVYRPGDCLYCGHTPRPCYPDTVRAYNRSFGYTLNKSESGFELAED